MLNQSISAIVNLKIYIDQHKDNVKKILNDKSKSIIEQCDNCHSVPGILPCKGCGKTKYCSEECEKNHWEDEHTYHCWHNAMQLLDFIQTSDKSNVETNRSRKSRKRKRSAKSNSNRNTLSPQRKRSRMK